MKYADIIIPRGRSNVKGIDFVVTNLKIKVPLDDLKHDNFSQKASSTKGDDLTPLNGELFTPKRKQSP